MEALSLRFRSWLLMGHKVIKISCENDRFLMGYCKDAFLKKYPENKGRHISRDYMLTQIFEKIKEIEGF